MKSEIFYQVFPVRTPQIEEPSPASTRPRVTTILLLFLVLGGFGVAWERSSAARLQMKSEDELLHDELAELDESREAVFDLRLSAHGDYLCFRSPAGDIHRVNISALGVEAVQKDLFAGRYSEEFQLSPVADEMAVSFLDKDVILQSLDPAASQHTVLDQTPEVIDCLSYSPDGRLLAGSSWRGLVYVWDVESRKRIAVIRRADDPITSLVFDSEMSLLVGFDTGIERWLIDPNQKSRDRRQLVWKSPHRDAAREMVVSPDGKYLIAASVSGMIEVWDLDRREMLWEHFGDSYVVRGLTVSQDSKSVFCFLKDNALMEFELHTGAKRLAYRDPQMSSGTGSGFSRQGDLFYSGYTDGFIRIWSPQEHVMLGKIDTATL